MQDLAVFIEHNEYREAEPRRIPEAFHQSICTCSLVIPEGWTARVVVGVDIDKVLVYQFTDSAVL